MDAASVGDGVGEAHARPSLVGDVGASVVGAAIAMAAAVCALQLISS